MTDFDAEIEDISNPNMEPMLAMSDSFMGVALQSLECLEWFGNEHGDPKVSALHSYWYLDTFYGKIVEYKWPSGTIVQSLLKTQSSLSVIPVIPRVSIENYYVTQIGFGSDFDGRDFVFRNKGNVYYTGQKNLCFAIRMERNSAVHSDNHGMVEFALFLTLPNATVIGDVVTANGHSKGNCLWSNKFTLDLPGYYEIVAKQRNDNLGPRAKTIGHAFHFPVIRSGHRHEYWEIGRNTWYIWNYWSYMETCIVQSSETNPCPAFSGLEHCSKFQWSNHRGDQHFQITG